jgi:hypothetical protein
MNVRHADSRVRRSDATPTPVRCADSLVRVTDFYSWIVRKFSVRSADDDAARNNHSPVNKSPQSGGYSQPVLG